MAVIILEPKTELSKEDLKTALEDYEDYLKITADLSKNIVGIGGEYHVDAEQILINKFNSKQRDIWGGGYNIRSKKFRTDALVNMRPLHENLSHEITDPKNREDFLKIAKEISKKVESLLK